MTPPARRKAIAYIRVSKEREEMISPETQEHSIKAFAEREGFEVVKWMSDIDKSGRDFTDRGVEEMIEGVKRGDWEAVILWKWSRWGRNLQQSTMFMAQFELAGGQVRASTEDFDRTTMMGKFGSDLQLLLAEFESNKISESWKAAQARRKRNGLPHTGIRRIGYTYSRADGYVVDPDMAPLVRSFYERYVAGAAMRSMAMEWNALGILTTRGGSWNATNLGRFLDTGFAAGLIRSRSNPPAKAMFVNLADFDVWDAGAHEAIISRETWDRYLARRMGMLGTKPKGKAPTHAFSKLLVCSECGARLTSIRTPTYAGWRCWRASSDKSHTQVNVSDSGVEKTVTDWLGRHAQGGEDAIQEARRYLAESNAVTDIGVLEKAITKLEAKRSRAGDAYVDGAFDVAELKVRQAGIDEELSTARAQLIQAQQSHEHITSIPDKRDFSDALVAWDMMPPVVRNEFLCSLIDQITVRPGRVSDTPDKITVRAVWEKLGMVG